MLFEESSNSVVAWHVTVFWWAPFLNSQGVPGGRGLSGRDGNTGITVITVTFLQLDALFVPVLRLHLCACIFWFKP